ncbi:hypothetical protein [Azospirillum sp.]|uniref:hypothetical protein n=1 Tax=Azospirillum sp. TaxID=34012 RepID=UPI002D35A7B8|nr:hypothetical protein [Azospirillum sp.]HYD65289.1 hypothetical protein [Azospirillum sp.]
MAVEFLRMKLRTSNAAPVLLSGPVVLQPHGAVDLLGDAMEHADAIVAAIDAFDAMTPLADQRLGESARETCFGCPARRRACSCIEATKVRVGTLETLNPVSLRPGEAAAIVRGTDAETRAALTRELTTFRAVRSAASACAA